jgi:hypothetical protein
VHHRDTLRASSRVEPAGLLPIEFHAPGKRCKGSRNQTQKR